jgi:hypothetical protein
MDTKREVMYIWGTLKYQPLVKLFYRCKYVIVPVFVAAGGYSHSCSILHEPEAPSPLHQEDTKEPCR